MSMSTEQLLAKIAEMETKQRELQENLAKAYAGAGDRLQLNGHLTIPKMQRQELVGRAFTATIKVKGVFTTSKNSGNVTARLTTKVPFADIEVVGDAPVAPEA